MQFLGIKSSTTSLFMCRKKKLASRSTAVAVEFRFFSIEKNSVLFLLLTTTIYTTPVCLTNGSNDFYRVWFSFLQTTTKVNSAAYETNVRRMTYDSIAKYSYIQYTIQTIWEVYLKWFWWKQLSSLDWD